MDEKIIIELEFKKNATVEEIKKAFNKYKKHDFLAMAEINGCIVYNNSENLDDDLFKAVHRLSEEKFQKIKKLEQEKEEQLKKLKHEKEIEEKILRNFLPIKNDELYKYYIGLSELFVVSEKIEVFKNTMIYRYDSPTKYSLARLVSSLLLILEEENMNSLYLKLNVLFSTIQTQDDREDLSEALFIVKAFGKKGDKLDEIMFSNQAEDFMEKKLKKIKSLREQINKLNDEYKKKSKDR